MKTLSVLEMQKRLIEAVEVRTDDTMYLVKVSTKLADRIENYMMKMTRLMTLSNQ
jgi:hypothetical protein